jgi:C-terminal processing protease CtpA/Prc
LVSIYDVLGKMPLRGQHPERYYWYTYLPDEETVYFHYYRCADDPSQPFADFNREMFEFIDANPVTRIVVDLRFNGGGNSAIFRPFLDEVRAREVFRQPGALYGLIGRQTFSSALMNAVELKSETGAILLGEPSGGNPNHFGEVRVFTLPNAGLQVMYSTRRFETMPDYDRDALVPDLDYPITWEDLLAGRDPAVEAALAGVTP